MTGAAPAPSRAVLTTGANSGIGLATVIELARRGFRSIGSVRSPAKADVVAKAAAEAGVEVETVLLDVTDSAGCRQAVGELSPYGVVNNAGYGQTGAIDAVHDGAFGHMVALRAAEIIRVPLAEAVAELKTVDRRLVHEVSEVFFS